MSEQVLGYLDQASHAIILFAVLVIVSGFLLAAGRFMGGYRELGPIPVFRRFKVELGRSLAPT